MHDDRNEGTHDDTQDDRHDYRHDDRNDGTHGDRHDGTHDGETHGSVDKGADADEGPELVGITEAKHLGEGDGVPLSSPS